VCHGRIQTGGHEETVGVDGRCVEKVGILKRALMAANWSEKNWLGRELDRVWALKKEVPAASRSDRFLLTVAGNDNKDRVVPFRPYADSTGPLIDRSAILITRKCN